MIVKWARSLGRMRSFGVSVFVSVAILGLVVRLPVSLKRLKISPFGKLYVDKLKGRLDWMLDEDNEKDCFRKLDCENCQV